VQIPAPFVNQPTKRRINSMNQNANFFPWDETPDSNVFPAMTGLFEYSKLEDGKSSTGKRMFRGQFTCLQPAELAGMSHFENFVTGTDENLDGIIPGSMGTRAMKASLKAAQVPPNNDIGAICDLVTATKPQLLLSLSYSKEEKGEYAGREQNRVTAWNKIGEREVQIAPKPGAVPSQRAPMQAPAAPGGQGGQAAPNFPQQTAPQAPQQAQTAQVGGQPAPPQPQAAPQAPQAPTAPQQAPAPQTPAAPAASAAPQGAPVPGINCTICGENVPADQFSAHVQAHAQG
jgi:hypothetical protein